MVQKFLLEVVVMIIGCLLETFGRKVLVELGSSFECVAVFVAESVESVDFFILNLLDLLVQHLAVAL
jgi:hypothetical protein